MDMLEPIKGTVRGKTIELEQPLSLPDGSLVLLSIELFPVSDEERRRQILDLSGAWKNDPSMTAVFEEIAQERRAHKEREVRIG
jgi:hypothetical protein